ncbi:helix-turn-helix domain-containing protein [Caulobacter sp. KR2-114]|uniref:helix-turn-helix domain-containing protein n=1 Tax=Caulobacter sp. KR2-114 TaxID=3400912 RepID=UPI003C01DFDF
MSDIDALLQTLSTRQHEVALCILAGDSNAEIAAYLNLHRTTVERHVAAVLRILGARCRSDLSRLGAANDNDPPARRRPVAVLAGF